jgi:hypothetical protein
VRDQRAAFALNRRYGLAGAARTARNLFFEFGVAELLDSTVLRPLAMGLGARFFGRALGVVVGKFAADVTFYVPVICAYELRRYLARSRAAAD